MKTYLRKESSKQIDKELIERLGEYRRLSWDDAVLAYEEELEDIVTQIHSSTSSEEAPVMRGNATIIKFIGKGYIGRLDTGQSIFIPISSFKGKKAECGDRIQCGILKVKNERIICLDAMECLSFSELKYRMFVSLEENDITLMASYAWAIYDSAPDELRDKMRICVHSLRNLYKKKKSFDAA